jgi:single-strand DNA-binding protein
VSGIDCAFTARLGRDSELRHVKGGTMPLLSFTAAVEERVQSDDTPAIWVRVVAFNHLAEQMAERLVKGTKVYVEGRLTAELWQPDDGRQPRVNIQVIANVLQPIGQSGRRRPRQTRSAERGQSTWGRSRDAQRHAEHSKAQRAGEAVLREAGRDSALEPPQSWLDDSREAIADLESRR